MIGIVVSRADPASVGIGEALLAETTWETRRDGSVPPLAGGGTVYHREGFELREFDELHLELEAVGRAFSDVDAIVFVSKHAGETGALLTTHVPGNVGLAEFGGTPHSVPEAAPNLMRAVSEELERRAPDGYDAGIECTHHGPSAVGAPTLFVEIGSDPRHWEDPVAARAVARAVLALEGEPTHRERTLVGFGGGHYAPRFTRILRETDWCVGHIAADWSLDEIEDRAVLAEIVDRLARRSHADVAVLDGDARHDDVLSSVIDLPIVSETWIREADGVPIDVVTRIEDLLGAIEEGTRIGDPAAEANALRRVDLPDRLVGAVNGHQPERARETVRSIAVGFDTREGGTQLGESIVLDADTRVLDVVEAFEPILASRYSDVRIAEDAVMLTETRFDPEGARSLGVPEGPAFGALAEGEAVEIDGERIEPEDVVRAEEIRIPVGGS